MWIMNDVPFPNRRVLGGGGDSLFCCREPSRDRKQVVVNAADGALWGQRQRMVLHRARPK